jgi:hypothetical protein
MAASSTSTGLWLLGSKYPSVFIILLLSLFVSFSDRPSIIYAIFGRFLLSLGATAQDLPRSETSECEVRRVSAAGAELIEA